MSGAFNSPKQRRRPAINLTSLIDVMFLLLIFFMVSSTFKEQMAIDIVLPEAGTANAQAITPHEIVVDLEGSIYFNEQAVDLSALRMMLIEVLAEDPETDLVLRADRAADFGRVIAAIDVAREVGGSRLIISTDPLSTQQ